MIAALALAVSCVALALTVWALATPWRERRAMASSSARRRRLAASAHVNSEHPPEGVPWYDHPHHRNDT